MNSTVATAREYIGTRYMHQARVKGVAVDCLGLIICVSREAGWVPSSYDVKGYRRLPDGHSLLAHLRAHFPEVSQADMRPGDVVCVAFDKHPHHVGFVGDYHLGGLSMIHAAPGGVVEQRLVFTSDMRFVAGFRTPGAN